MSPLVDSHVHLHFPEYAGDLAQVLERARQAGVVAFINVGTDAQDAARAFEVAKSHKDVYAVVGIHPHEADRADEKMFFELSELLREEQVKGIGEIGLDYYRNHSSRERQEEVFRRFLGIHRQIRKPVVIHCRDAYEDTRRIIVEEGGILGGVMHCYSSDFLTMRQFLDLGFYISFAGSLTYKKNSVLREACRACPPDRLLIETDGPYLAPEPLRGKRNEPAYLKETAKVAADLHGLSPDALADRTTKNAFALFGLC